ncbi:MAG TPA: SDR family oxidoreductase [Candidatus Lokiarchaeia archaeon]|nr:SDR family oxidoreductase [Candidatus Lokiarchaeia archaeon]
MQGKIVLITGATSGIGNATAIELARQGATLILTTRDDARGAATKEEITQLTGNANIEVLHCDLASFTSIRAFTEEFKEKHDHLDVLINNAGTWDFKRRESADGIENIFAVNFLAPFLMTNLLLDLLQASAPARIINITSGLHSGTIHFEDIEFKRKFSGFKAYSQSKLALILFTRILAKKLEGTGVVVNCVHPGLNRTDLGRDSGRVTRWMFQHMGQDPQKGAETAVYLASDPAADTVTSEYFVKKQVKKSSKTSYDMAIAQKLWEVAAKYVGL